MVTCLVSYKYPLTWHLLIHGILACTCLCLLAFAPWSCKTLTAIVVQIVDARTYEELQASACLDFALCVSPSDSLHGCTCMHAMFVLAYLLACLYPGCAKCW